MTEEYVRPQKGIPVVLTADRTLMADYPSLFDGMVSASQTTRTPGLVMRHLLAPAVRNHRLRSVLAPLGLRRIEAALLESGWAAADVAVVSPEQLDQAVGPRTVIIGISSGDPLGAGMNSSTMVGICGGEIYTSRWFQHVSKRIDRLRTRAPGARTVMGGPGAWQLAGDGGARRRLGIDHILTGYCEGNVARVLARIAGGEDTPPVLCGRDEVADAIPRIRGGTVMGSVEISRGCGLGCAFCSIARVPMIHLPPETIMADIDTNVAAGNRVVSLITEDVFRYGADGARVRPHMLIALLRRMREIPGLNLIQTDHANIASVARYTDSELAEVHHLLAGERRQNGYTWLNLGVETAAGELLAANGGGAKLKPYSPEEWGCLCAEQVRRLQKAGFFPLVSLIVGLPGETLADIEKTLRWVCRLRGTRAAVFPMFYAPIDGRGGAFGAADMLPIHWRLFRECYGLNFKWIPRLCWDNQSQAGAALWRRLLTQTLGHFQSLWWRSLFAWKSGGLSL